MIRSPAAFAALLFAVMLAPALRGDDKFPIAVVNVDKLFNGYKQHAERLAPLHTSAKETDETVQVRQVELETAANQFRKIPPNTPEQLQAQAKLLKLQNDLKVFVDTERQKLQKREVNAIIASQNDFDVAIKKICKDRGIKLVLRTYNPPDENQPLQEVVKGLNRDVVFQDGLDITDDVLKALNEMKPSGR
jgi:Skp family chaperone for outer membrane proteins